MIIVFLNWVFIFFTTFSIGFLGLRLLRFVYGFALEKETIHPTVISILGLALITSIGNYTSLFYSIHWEFTFILSLGSCLVFGVYFKSILHYFKSIPLPKIHYLTVIAGLAFVCIALLKAAGATEVWDEGQYFLPLIRWIENYPVVPGTGLFHDRMAYNSSFHLSSAIYSHVYAFEGGLYDLNAYLFVILNLYLLKGINRMLTQIKEARLADFLMLFGNIVLYRLLITSIDVDYPHIFIGLLVIVLFLEKSTAKALKTWDANASLLVVLILFLVSVKFLAVYFLLFILVLFYFQIRAKKWRNVWLSLAIGTAYILPWFVRNVYLSGYLVYPIYWLDVFSFDWKIPLIIAKNDYLYVSEHAKILIDRHTLYYDGVEKVAVQEWLPLWWEKHMMHDLSALITGLFLLPSLLLLPFIFIKKRTVFSKGNLAASITLFISFLFILFWFFQYPDVRFGWHWVLFVLVFVFYQLAFKIWKLPFHWIKYACVILLFLTLSRATYKSFQETEVNFFSQHIVFPKSVNALEEHHIKKIGSIDVIVAESMFCWGALPPCMPEYYDELTIKMRGNRMEDGFKIQE